MLVRQTMAKMFVREPVCTSHPALMEGENGLTKGLEPGKRVR